MQQPHLKLKFLRLSKGLNQASFSKKMSFSRSHLANLETMPQLWSDYHREMFTKHFQLPSDFFSDAEEDPKLNIWICSIWQRLLKRDTKLLENELNRLTTFTSNLEQTLQLQLLLASHCLQTGSFKEAKKIKTNFIDNYHLHFGETSSPLTEQLQLYFNIQHHKSLDEYEQGIKNCYVLKNKRIDSQSQSLLDLSLIYFYLKIRDHEKAQDLLLNIQNDIQSLGCDTVLAEYYSYLTALHIRLKLPNKALETLDQLEQVAQRSQLTQKLWQVYQNRGVIYGRFQKDSEMALKAHQKYLELVQETNHKGWAYRSILTHLIHLKRFEEAEAVLAKAKKLNLSPETEMGILVLEGQLALYQNNLKWHRHCHKISHNYYLEQNDIEMLWYIYSYLAEHAKAKNKLKEALEYYSLKAELGYAE